MQFIIAQPVSEICALLQSVFRIWTSVLRDTHEPFCDLPLFNGVQRYSYTFDTIVGTGALNEIEAQCDLQELWERLALNRPIVVLGCNPAVTSRAVRLLAAVLRPFSPPRVLPYIPITHPHFLRMARNPIGIIGISNPVAVSFLQKPVKILKVGFCPASPNPRTIERYLNLVNNSHELAAAVQDSLSDMAKSEPQSFLQRQMNITLLIQKLASHGVSTSIQHREFALKFIAVPIFLELYRKFLPSSEQKAIA
jgi:hypothetical protein